MRPSHCALTYKMVSHQVRVGRAALIVVALHAQSELQVI